MKRTIPLLALLLLFATAPADRYTSSAGSAVKVTGTSTLHAWTMEGTTIDGQITATAIDQATVVVTIPVTSIKSEHAKMDKLMAEALKAKSNPEIRYELTDSALANGNDAAFAVKTKGKLTIAGVSREIDMAVSGAKNADGRYVLTGEAPLRMTDFGIKPPTAMLGTIKTGDDVKVSFRWIVQPAR